jgi:hypothetical protein
VNFCTNLESPHPIDEQRSWWLGRCKTCFSFMKWSGARGFCRMVWRMCICLWMMRRLGREEEDQQVLRVRMGQDRVRARTLRQTKRVRDHLLMLLLQQLKASSHTYHALRLNERSSRRGSSRSLRNAMLQFAMVREGVMLTIVQGGWVIKFSLSLFLGINVLFRGVRAFRSCRV